MKEKSIQEEQRQFPRRFARTLHQVGKRDKGKSLFPTWWSLRAKRRGNCLCSSCICTKMSSFSSSNVKEKSTEKGDCGPPTRKCEAFCWTWTKRYLPTWQTGVKRICEIARHTNGSSSNEIYKFLDRRADLSRRMMIMHGRMSAYWFLGKKLCWKILDFHTSDDRIMCLIWTLLLNFFVCVSEIHRNISYLNSNFLALKLAIYSHLWIPVVQLGEKSVLSQTQKLVCRKRISIYVKTVRRLLKKVQNSQKAADTIGCGSNAFSGGLYSLLVFSFAEFTNIDPVSV